MKEKEQEKTTTTKVTPIAFFEGCNKAALKEIAAATVKALEYNDARAFALLVTTMLTTFIVDTAEEHKRMTSSKNPNDDLLSLLERFLDRRDIEDAEAKNHVASV